MKAFVINLDKDTERLEIFSNDFKNSNFLQIEKVNGIYGENISSQETTKLCNLFCSNGMKGCFASHKSIWKKIVNENIPISIIFEDDATPISPDYEKQIQQQIKDTPDNFDIIVLHNTLNRINDIPVYEKLVLQCLGLYNYSNKKLSNNVYIPEFTYELVSYVISYKGAKKLLDIFPKINYHVDISIFKQYKKLNIYTVKNPIFKQQSKNSNNIHTLKTFDNNLSPMQLILNTTFLKINYFNMNIINTIILFIIIITIGVIAKRPKLAKQIILVIILLIVFVYRVMLQ